MSARHEDVLRPYITQADFLLKQLRSTDPNEAAAGAKRFAALARFAGYLAPDLIDKVRRRDALDVIAVESGAPNWREFRTRQVGDAEKAVKGLDPFGEDWKRRMELSESYRVRLEHAGFVRTLISDFELRLSGLQFEDYYLSGPGFQNWLSRADLDELTHLKEWARQKRTLIEADIRTLEAEAEQRTGYRPGRGSTDDVIDAALSIAEWPEDRPVSELLRALRILSHALRNSTVEVERERARRRRSEPPGESAVEGHRLVDGRDGGGRRHFLAGRAVHAGTGLMLFTRQGWVRGRYESDRGDPFFIFRPIPGSDDEASLRIGYYASLAWPDEFERR